MLNNTVETKPFLGVSSTRSSMVKMTARWGKGYIQMVWWINKHDCLISNVFLCVIALPRSGTFKLRATTSAWDFLGDNFWSRDFFSVLLEALGISWVLTFDFTRSSTSLKIPRTPPPPPPPPPGYIPCSDHLGIAMRMLWSCLKRSRYHVQCEWIKAICFSEASWELAVIMVMGSIVFTPQQTHN